MRVTARVLKNKVNTKSVLVVMFEDGIFMEDGLFTLSWVISQRVRCGSEGNVISFSPETLSLC